MGYDVVREHLLLSAEEEADLAQKIEAVRTFPNDPSVKKIALDARKRLIESNLRLAMKMARKHRAPEHVDREDMIQDAMLGLERAVEGFDWRRGFRFSTYASWWIRQSIQTGLEQTSGSVRIPAQRAHELHAALHHTNGNVAELSPRLGRTMAMASMASLDKVTSDSGAGLGDRVPATGSDPLQQLIIANDQTVARELLASLDETNRYLVERRFGFDGRDPATFTEIARRTGDDVNALKTRYYRAIQRIREKLDVTVAVGRPGNREERR